MAERRTSGRTGSRSNQLLRSVHEGWAYHFTPQSRVWVKRWLVLDGSRLVVFSSERSSSQAVIVSLSLGQGTKVKDIILQPHVHGLDIQLSTMKGLKESRIDFFGFSTPNECDLWKAYILGFSYGIVPENLNLLPGQLKDVREAIIDVGQAPPPLPMSDPKRPTLRNLPGFAEHKRPGLQMNVSSSLNSSPSLVTSPYSDISEGINNRSVNFSPDEVFENDEEPDIIEKLELRRAELAMMALDKEIERGPKQLTSHGIELRKVHPFASPMAKTQQLPVWSQPQSMPPSTGKDSIRISSDQIASQKSRTPVSLGSNNELLPFYDDPGRNKIPPLWFINCSREDAEMILTAARNHGNVLMRPSYSVNPRETYVISMRRDLPGGLELRHYAVYRTSEGFKLDVIDKHRPMSCLSEVLDFFTYYVGPSAQPINSHEVGRILGEITTSGLASFSKSSSFAHDHVSSAIDATTSNEAKADKNVTTITVINSEVVIGGSQVAVPSGSNGNLKELEESSQGLERISSSASTEQETASIPPKADLSTTVHLNSVKGSNEEKRGAGNTSASIC